MRFEGRIYGDRGRQNAGPAGERILRRDQPNLPSELPPLPRAGSFEPSSKGGKLQTLVGQSSCNRCPAGTVSSSSRSSRFPSMVWIQRS